LRVDHDQVRGLGARRRGHRGDGELTRASEAGRGQAMIEVDLKPGLRGGPWARLRELRGDDELWAAQGRGASSLVAVELLDRLLVAAPGTTIAPGRARELAVGDRDRLLAAIYRHTFGK